MSFVHHERKRRAVLDPIRIEIVSGPSPLAISVPSLYRRIATTTCDTFHRQRCLIPADDFYEWKRLDEKTKQPYAFALVSGEPFASGRVWDTRKDPVAEGIGTTDSASASPAPTNSLQPFATECQ